MAVSSDYARSHLGRLVPRDFVAYSVTMNQVAHRSLAKHLLAAFAGVWLYAALLPCVLADAAPRCDQCPPAHSTHGDTDPCAGSQTDCSLPDVQPISFDWLAGTKTATVLLATLPIANDACNIAPRRHTKNAVSRAPPPLALRPAVLLI